MKLNHTKLIIIKALILMAPIFASHASDVGLPGRGITPRREEIDFCDMLRGSRSNDLIGIPPKIEIPSWGANNVDLDLNENKEINFDFNSDIDFATQIKKEAIIKQIMGHLAHIIDLKGRVTTFLEDNREVYGRYVSLTEQKELFASRVKRLEVERKSAMDDVRDKIASIGPEHGTWKTKRMINALEEQLSSQLSYIDKDLSPSKDRLRKIEDEYFDVLSQWSPYQEYLSQLENLESNLMKSLKTLKEVEAASRTTTSNNTGSSYGNLADLSSRITKPINIRNNGSINNDWLINLRKYCKP